jgi:hypothetical protein
MELVASMSDAVAGSPGSDRSSFEGDVSTAAEALSARGRSFETSRDGSFETSRPTPSFDMPRRSFDTDITRPPSLADSSFRRKRVASSEYATGEGEQTSGDSEWEDVMDEVAAGKMRESMQSVICMERPSVRFFPLSSWAFPYCLS